MFPLRTPHWWCSVRDRDLLCLMVYIHSRSGNMCLLVQSLRPSFCYMSASKALLSASASKQSLYRKLSFFTSKARCQNLQRRCNEDLHLQQNHHQLLVLLLVFVNVIFVENFTLQRAFHWTSLCLSVYNRQHTSQFLTQQLKEIW